MTTRSTIASIAAALALVGAAPSLQAEQPAMTYTSGYIAANGVDYWYEIHGEGEPLLLLHGGLMSSGVFGPVLPQLAEKHRVIRVDLHGHGRTALGDRKITAVDIGRD